MGLDTVAVFFFVWWANGPGISPTLSLDSLVRDRDRDGDRRSSLAMTASSPGTDGLGKMGQGTRGGEDLNEALGSLAL